MEDQHKGMIIEVKRGRFDPGGDRTVMEDLSLDEIVLAYLASRAAAEVGPVPARPRASRSR